jgi:hypothetical protein
MIIRCVFVKLADELCTANGRSEFAATSQVALAAIPGVLSAECGPAADPQSEAAWDVVLTVRFADMDAVSHYATHPLHLAYLEEVMKPAAVFKKAWNFRL